MNKFLLCFLLALIGLVQPTAYAAVNYGSVPISTKQSNSSGLPRTKKVKNPHKVKGVERTQRASFNTLTFIAVFMTIASVALIVLGLVLGIKALWVAGVVFASLMFFFFIAFIIALIGGLSAS